MALTKKPVTGMKDITSAEMQTYEYMMNQIKEAYKSFGFTQTGTPCVKHIGNLTSKQSGDNERLIFKMLKRGDKLNLEGSKEENDLVDSGLRYDLTLPLSHYYANNAVSLSSFFKALQMGSVWRAGRPQRSRFRQFVQCDVDILRDATSLARIGLILATTTTLGRVCPDNSPTVRINDKGISRGMALYYGFAEESMDQVFTTLDRMDRIGHEGVEKELLESGHNLESVSKYLDMPKNVTKDSAGVRALGQMLPEVMPIDVSEGLTHIIDTVAEVAEVDFDLGFDPTLVRGMPYYTGTAFEVSIEGFGGSVADGGRYGKMIGEFTGMETSVYGFSIGFGRIITIFMDNGFTVPGVSDRETFLFEEGVDSARLTAVIREAMKERKKGVQVLVAQMSENRKLQEEQLGKEGYMEFKESYKESLKN